MPVRSHEMMCRCFFVPLLPRHKIFHSVGLLCYFLYSIKKPFEIFRIFIFLYSLLVFICKAWMENGSLYGKVVLKTGWFPLPSPLVSPKIWQSRSETVLSTSKLSRDGDPTAPAPHFDRSHGGRFVFLNILLVSYCSLCPSPLVRSLTRK